VLEAVAIGLQVKADLERGAADIAAKLARGAAGAAGLAQGLADRAEGEAQALGAIAARDKAAAQHDIAAARALAAALAREVVRKAATVVRAVARVVAKAAVVVGKAAVAVAKVAYKVSGVQSIVSCVTDPGLSSCLQAALTVALVVGTAGSGEIADIAAEGALDAAEDAGAAAAEDTAEATAEKTGTDTADVTQPRPSFRKGTIRDAWDNAEDGPNGGKLCPTCGDEVNVEPGAGPRDWDIDHQPPWSLRIPELSEDPGLTRGDVIDNYQEGTRLECPACNRGRGANPAW
jgi:hypothetical protein